MSLGGVWRGDLKAMKKQMTHFLILRVLKKEIHLLRVFQVEKAQYQTLPFSNTLSQP